MLSMCQSVLMPNNPVVMATKRTSTEKTTMPWKDIANV